VEEEEALDSWQVVTKKHSSKSKSRKSKHGKSKHGKSKHGKSKHGKQKKLEVLPSIPEGDETQNGGRRTRKALHL
jgi:hypothetical protein